MIIEFTVSQRIGRSVADVYDAIANPDKLCRYFTQTASGPLVTGAQVRWTWAGGAADDCDVVEAVPNERIICRWKAYEVDDVTTCTFSIENRNGEFATLRIHETGWSSNEAGIKSAFEHCAGWQHFALALKAWIEHGIDLRKTPAATTT